MHHLYYGSIISHYFTTSSKSTTSAEKLLHRQCLVLGNMDLNFLSELLFRFHYIICYSTSTDAVSGSSLDNGSASPEEGSTINQLGSQGMFHPWHFIYSSLIIWCLFMISSSTCNSEWFVLLLTFYIKINWLYMIIYLFQKVWIMVVLNFPSVFSSHGTYFSLF